MKKKGLVGLLVVGLLVVLTSVAMAECKPSSGYPTIDAWRLAGCQNEWERNYGGYLPYALSPYGIANGYSNRYSQDYDRGWRGSPRGRTVPPPHPYWRYPR